jgi:hypothetical protein
MRPPNPAISSYSMPTVHEFIHKLNGSKVFSKLDLRHGYLQMLLAPESRHITTGRLKKTESIFGTLLREKHLITERSF